ncbi:RNA polymerase sigma factor [Herbidospora daliensis]|uniref:RNA polymerase sigma factor n=1 Tax=Herbidospora daliensis TaxID=295585 RepID=UPI000786501F|nr:RNA polymerase sigma factor [Herbidospora daliensis]
MTPDSDAALLAAVAEGRLEALRVLHHRHAPWLRARLARRCGDPDLVQSALQDTFVAVWQDAGRYRPSEGAAGAWLWTIAIRKLVSALRGRPAPVAAEAAVTESAEDLVLRAVEHGDLGTALNRLSPELRAAIRATVLDGLTVKEAARLLGVPEGTVKTRVMRAKAQLRELLT